MRISPRDRRGPGRLGARGARSSIGPGPSSPGRGRPLPRRRWELPSTIAQDRLSGRHAGDGSGPPEDRGRVRTGRGRTGLQLVGDLPVRISPGDRRGPGRRRRSSPARARRPPCFRNQGYYHPGQPGKNAHGALYATIFSPEASGAGRLGESRTRAARSSPGPSSPGRGRPLPRRRWELPSTIAQDRL